ncbi:hypothetical protein GCM10023311_09360 [Flaviramulus aquimarinus]|uniref:T9SS type A sorting domain-containing protein n=1 Tax=Flaviramulus aquimarinus TaxID=1170456 RepID=A0ABP9EX05_9FLAO
MKKNTIYSRYLFILICSLFLHLDLNAQQFRRVDIQAGLGEIFNNNGVAVADYDLDNDLDIFIVGEKTFDENNPTTWSRLLKNNNNGSFEDVTIEAGFAEGFNHDINLDNGLELGDKMAVSWGDYDDDGYPDIFLANAGQSQLYHNNGNGTFSDVTILLGINTFCENCYYSGALWFDNNNDGFLDLYLTDYKSTTDNKLFQNNGNGTFTLISDTNVGGQSNSLSAIPIIANDDAYIDLYVANDFAQNNFFLVNQNGTGFTEAAIEFGIEDPFCGMGLATCDFDNNGVFELLVTNIDTNGFYVKNGENTYENLAQDLGIFNTGWSWGINFSDFNHDGYEDLYIANGMIQKIPNKYFKNVPGPNGRAFEDTLLTDSPIEESKSRSTISFDYDNDGDLDLIVTNFSGKLYLYENTSIDTFFTNETSGNYIKIELEGTASNTNAIGTKVELYPNTGPDQFRYHHGSAYLSQSILPVHFGLSTASVINSIVVTWPLGSKETFFDVPVNNTIKITEGSGYSIVPDNTAVKIEGCTDTNSCNYDPNATIDNGSCLFLEAGSITGNTTTNTLSVENYTYSSNTEDQFEWTVTNGEILDGQGTNSISVRWHVASQGRISIISRNDICSTDVISLNITLTSPDVEENDYSVARLWNEVLLDAIRNDFARPTVHARNLFHTSIAMYDAWAIYNDDAQTYFIGKEVQGFSSELDEFISPQDTIASINETLSYAAYRILKHRFSKSPNAQITSANLDDLMALLGYDTNETSVDYSNSNPAALGNYIAAKIIEFGFQDGTNESNAYDNEYYEPVNDPLVPAVSGNETISDPNRWQPLSLEVFIDQSGNVIRETTPGFLSPEWGNASPFALNNNMLTNFERDSNTYRVFHDPGQPPTIGTGDAQSNDIYKWGFSLVSVWGAHLSPDDGVLWDISPKSIGNIPISLFPNDFADYDDFYNLMDGGDIGTGHSSNPITNAPYQPQMVPRGDYARVLAEFWADGPDSETPPGHWFVLLNYVSDHPLFEKRMKGEGDILNNLEWDVKSYFMLAGAMHDAAISAWSIKGWYDYTRPISAIRYMADKGQSTDNTLDNYHEDGIPLMDGFIEIVNESDDLAGTSNEHLGKIKLNTWRGHDYINDVETDVAGVGWILAENWWPYQRPSFVTPPFAGYVSGHSTYSRAAAEIMTLLTGTEFFPGGMGEFIAKQNEFLVFEEGPSQDITLQWATYRDASDQCSLSRIWGGIHPPMDDIPGRIIGEQIGIDAFNLAESYFIKPTTPNEVNQESGMTLYPNPLIISNEITITNTFGNEEFILFDLYGNLIPVSPNYFEENSTTKIEINNLSTGLYILKSNKKSWKVIIR